MSVESMRWSSSSVADKLFRIPAELEKIYTNFEPMTSVAVTENLKEGSRFLDVGANFGYFTLLASACVGESGQVFAIEASPDVLPILKSNIRENNLKNVSIFECAAGNVEDTVDFYLTEDYVNSGVAPSPFMKVGKQVSVNRMPLDKLLADKAQSIDLVKIDVQGDELAVIEGARVLFDQSPELKVIVEWAPAWMENAGFQPYALPELLMDFGFRQLTVIDEYTGQMLDIDSMLKIFSLDKTGRRFCNVFARK